MPLRFAVLEPSPSRPCQQLSPASLHQPSPAQPSPASPQSMAKGLCLLDSDVAFSAARRHRFGSVFGLFGAAVPLRFAVLEPSPSRPCQQLSPASLHQPSPAQPSQPSPAQPSPAQPTPAQPAPARPSPAQPSPASPHQPSPAQPSPNLGVGVGKALPKPFLTGFRGAILGRRNAPFLVHFWLVWGRRAAAFRRFGTLVFGPVFGAFPGLPSIPIALVPRQSPAQPSPDQLSRCVWVPAQPPPNRPAPIPAHPSQPAQLVGEASQSCGKGFSLFGFLIWAPRFGG